MINQKSEYTFVEHLDELRKRLIVVLIAFFISLIISFPAAPQILGILKSPSGGLISKLAFFAPQEALVVLIKISILFSFVLCLPVILYELWAFVCPAIQNNLRKYVPLFVLFSFLFFLGGCFFAYFMLLPFAIKFLLSFARQDLVPIISVERYISFVAAFLFGAGAVFEMPVLSFLFTKTRVVNHKMLRNNYKYAVLIIFIVSAVITPTPDIATMIIFAVPMLLLYEISVWVSFFSKVN